MMKPRMLYRLCSMLKKTLPEKKKRKTGTVQYLMTPQSVIYTRYCSTIINNLQRTLIINLSLPNIQQVKYTDMDSPCIGALHYSTKKHTTRLGIIVNVLDGKHDSQVCLRHKIIYSGHKSTF